MLQPYLYYSTNSELISDMEMADMAAGGYLALSGTYSPEIPSPFAGGKLRPVGSAIYSLLTPHKPLVYIHRNKSLSTHVHHQGRAEYILITPRPDCAEEDWKPTITPIIHGEDISAKEQRQILVPTETWKMIFIPEKDLEHARECHDEEKIGCLFTEINIPGFVPEDHEVMTMDQLRELFGKGPHAEKEIKRFSRFIMPQPAT